MTVLGAAALYTGINILLLFLLSFRVVGSRMRTKVSLGSGGDPDLVRLHRQRLDFLTQQFAAAKDELSRRALQQSLEALASEIRGSF